MVEIYGKHFIYNDVYSSQYGLIIANVDTSRETKICGDKKGYFVFNKASKSNYLIDDDYTDSPMTFDIEIVTCDGHALDINTIREVERWLFTNSTFKKMYIDPTDDFYGETYELVFGVQKKLYFNCRFLYPEKIEYQNGVVGFKCTLETDSMMLWQDAVSVSFDFSEIIYSEGEEGVPLLKGDVNFDGVVSIRDAQTILYAAVAIMDEEENPLTELQTLVADMNCDGRITPVDAQMALKIASDDLSEYAVEKEYVIVDGVKHYTAEGSKVIEVPVDSDIDGYTYPTITIRMGSIGGALTITNYNDSTTRVTEFSGLEAGAEFTIDCQHSLVMNGSISMSINGSSNDITLVDTREHSVELYNKMTSKKFPRLVEGDNQIVVTGNVLRMSFSWQNRRFL